MNIVARDLTNTEAVALERELKALGYQVTIELDRACLPNLADWRLIRYQVRCTREAKN